MKPFTLALLKFFGKSFG